jgi:Anticodon binding domain
VRLRDRTLEQTLEAILRRTEQLSNEGSWNLLNVSDMLKEENARLGLKSKVFNTVLRHALTGMKVCPFRSVICQSHMNCCALFTARA